MLVSKTLVVLSAALSALASPHVARGPNHHALAARAAIPNAAPEALAEPKRIRKRADTSRCKVRTSSAEPTTTSFTPIKNVASEPTPEPTKEPEPEPEPEPTPTEKPTTTKKTSTPKPTTTKASGGGGGGGGADDPRGILSGNHVGQGTFYNTGLVACGSTHNDGEFIVALSMETFDNYPGYKGGNPNNNPLCKRMIRATYKGKSVDVMAVDRCVGCAPWDLDFSPAAFEKLASFDEGRINGVTWHWL